MNRLLKGCAVSCGVLVVVAVIVVVAVATTVAGVSWFRGVYMSPKPPDPKIGKSFALRPLIGLRNGKLYGTGTASAVRLRPNEPPILLTALHLFGPDGGLERNLAPAELDQVVYGIFLFPFGSRTHTALARGAVRKSGPALRDGDSDMSGDIAAFNLPPKSRVNALNLATANPSVGQWLWVVGDVVTHEPQSQRLFPCRVLHVSDEATFVEFESVFPQGEFSGAPLINEHREVAGIVIGGDKGRAVINPAGSIRKRLAESGR